MLSTNFVVFRKHVLRLKNLNLISLRFPLCIFIKTLSRLVKILVVPINNVDGSSFLSKRDSLITDLSKGDCILENPPQRLCVGREILSKWILCGAVEGPFQSTGASRKWYCGVECWRLCLCHNIFGFSRIKKSLFHITFSNEQWNWKSNWNFRFSYSMLF